MSKDDFNVVVNSYKYSGSNNNSLTYLFNFYAVGVDELYL